jgi:hypothetical protein
MIPLAAKDLSSVFLEDSHRSITANIKELHRAIPTRCQNLIRVSLIEANIISGVRGLPLSQELHV